MIRDMTLAELGFRNGVTFRQLSGTQTVYFPVPTGPEYDSMEFHLSVATGSTTPADRYVQISVAGRILATRGLSGDENSFALNIPIDAGDVQSGFVPIRFDYSGANTERVCFDERMSGDFLTVEPQSGLRLVVGPDQIATSDVFAALKPAPVVLGLPDNAGLADLAALTRASALLDAERGLVRFDTSPNSGPDWTVARINIRATADGPVSDMTVATENALPELLVTGTDPQIGLAQLLSPWAGLAGEGRTVTSAANQPAVSGNRLPLAALGGDLSSRAVKGSEDFTVNFSASDIPPGKVVSDLVVTAVSGLDPEGNGATLSVALNEVLLGSRTLSAGEPQNLSFAVPAGLIGSENTLRFHVQRQPVAGACRYTMQGYPAQILPGSALVLADGGGEAQEFYELRQAAGQGVQLVIDRDLSLSSAELAPWLAGVAGSILPDRAPVVPRADMAALQGDMPFIVVSDIDPAGSEADVRLSEGRIEIRDTAGELLFDGDGLSRIGVVQMISVNGVAGLWLKPGKGPAPVWTEATPLRLDRGNLALLDERGLVLATSTQAGGLIEVSYPDATRLADILERYRVWIIGGLWLLITLFVLGVFQRLYRRHNAPSAQDD